MGGFSFGQNRRYRQVNYMHTQSSETQSNGSPRRQRRPRVQIIRAGGWLAVGVLLACRPAAAPASAPVSAPESAVEGAGSVSPAADDERPRLAGNSGSELVASATRITSVVVVDLEGQSLGELPATVVEGLQESVRGGIAGDLSATTPPWDIALQIRVSGRAAFIAIPVGFDRVRLSPDDPYDARIADAEGEIDRRVQEVVVGEATHDAIAALIGPRTAKEYQRPPIRGL